MDNSEEKSSYKEDRIRKITHLYYSRKDVQQAIFDFSENRETVPRFMMDSFGKRPDSLQYPGDIFEMVKKGATSFHCSEELWSDPLKLSTDLNEQQYNELRLGWDLLIDIDSKYLDYSKITAELILELLSFHGLNNVGIKFSGSKGFHLLIPWKAFPKKVYEFKTSDMFPEWPRIISKYVTHQIRNKLIEKITLLTASKGQSKYVRDFEIPKQVMPDIILVSPRHLFRMPYSLHEKTGMASVVLSKEQIHNFQPTDADSFKVEIKSFTPKVKEGEASELLMQALDWDKEVNTKSESTKKNLEFKPIKIDKLSDDFFPPSIQNILKGLTDGKKRALFILINLFRSIGIEKEELEKRIFDWNKKNQPPLREGYIKAQLSWSYKNKIVPPPNFDKDYYKGIGVVPTEEEIRYKNPVNYILKKSIQSNKANEENFKESQKTRNTTNFKKKI